jgi:nitrite reductase (NADH) small subunit
MMPKPITAAVCDDVSPDACPVSSARQADTVQANVARWTRICRTDEIPRLGARVVRRGIAPNIAVFRTASDAYFALADRCPHRGGPLSQGIVYGERVACPLHNTNVELESGCAVAPDEGRVARFAVKVDADFVYIDLSTLSDADH